MLYHVRMDVLLPTDMDVDMVNELKTTEKPCRKNYKSKVNGVTFGVWLVSMPTLAFSMLRVMKSYTIS